jgi:hypothetical protein
MVNTQLIEHPTSLGEVILRQHCDSHGEPESVEVLHADPRVLISGELLRQVHAGTPHERVPFAMVDKPEVGGTLTIRATTGNLVYRLTEYEPLHHGYRVPDTYVGEWPD